MFFCLLVISFLLIPSCGRFLPALSSCSSMGRAHIGELGDQIPMRSHSILRNLSVCDESDEGVEYILGECPSINGKGRNARRVIGQEIRQQCACHPSCFRGRISSRVLKRVRENSDETRVASRLTGEVRLFFVARKDVGLRGQRATVHLDPASSPAGPWNKSPGPKANLLVPQRRVRHFKSDAAHVLVSEEIVAGELKIVFCAFHVAEEWVATPADKEAIIAGVLHHRLASR